MLKGLEFDFDHKVLMTRAVSSQPCCEGFAKLLDSSPTPLLLTGVKLKAKTC